MKVDRGYFVVMQVIDPSPEAAQMGFLPGTTFHAQIIDDSIDVAITPDWDDDEPTTHYLRAK